MRGFRNILGAVVAVSLGFGAGDRFAAGHTNPAPKRVVASYDGGAISLADIDALDAQEIFKARSRTLLDVLRKSLIDREANRRGVTVEALLRTEVDGKVTPFSDEEGRKFVEQAIRDGRAPPDATYDDDLRRRLSEMHAGRAGRERLEAFSEELLKKEHGVIDWDALGRPRTQVSETGPSRGPEKAPITIVEFADFECPYCATERSVVREMEQRFNGQVRIIFKQNPSPAHPHAAKAAEAAWCAADQGKFWEYHDVLFENQNALEPSDLRSYAVRLGLDVTKFSSCVGSGTHSKDVQADVNTAQRAGIQGSPAFLINGVLLSGAAPAETFARALREELASKRL